MQNIFSSIAAGITAIIISVASFVGFVPKDQLGATIPTVVATFSTSLASEISSSATSFTLLNGTTTDGTTLNGLYGFVIGSSTSSEEFILATCVNTACTGATRGVSVITGNTSITALKHAHSRGASVKISDHPILAILARIMNGDESFPNPLILGGKATYVNTETINNDKDLVSKAYVDSAVTAGAPNASTTAKGIVEEATDAELAAGTAAGGTAARLFANGASFNQTPAANKVPVALATGLLNDGWLGLTTAGDMCYSDGSVLQRLAIGTNTYYLTSNGSAPVWGGANLAEANTCFGSTDISGAELEDLSDGGETTLHSHDISALVYPMGWIASDVLLQSADTERTSDVQAATKKKEIVMLGDGIIRITFDYKKQADGGSAITAQVYKNGVAFGTLKSSTSQNYATWSEDLAFLNGDLIQIYLNCTNNGLTAYVRNFRIYATKKTTFVVNTD